jgi:antitoxin (DNA-binding transcriptional repressor) of toxin-antitoxin stability system
MKEVGVREFRDHATSYLSGSEPVAVSKHGHVVGVYFPMKRDQERIKRDLDKLGETVQEILVETGMSEDELVEFFDPRPPVPELSDSRRR